MDLRANYFIEPELFDKHEVNRGLRKKNGTGVLVGLTRIGDVHGYELVKGVKVPAAGKLFYRGIDVKDFIDSCVSEGRYAFEEMAYLLLIGKLPTAAELKKFKSKLYQKQEMPAQLSKVLRRIPVDSASSNIMNYLNQCVLAMYNHEAEPDSTSLETVLEHCLALIARFPLMVACAYYSGKLIPDANPELSFAENFLRMIRHDGKYTKTEAAIMDTAMILHAEHGGGNNSSFTVHVVSSTGTDTFSAIGAAVGSLKGPKHGGANSEVLHMMEEIKANVSDWTNRDEISEYLAKIIRKEAGNGSGLIYGMGHAVYTLFDPRAEILKKQAIVLAHEKGREDEMNLYLLIEELAPAVFAKVKGSSKVMCANVDFFTGFIYDMLGIPEYLCTPIFAMSRVVGWCAHRIDELVNGGKIIRPAFRDVSEAVKYIPIKMRGNKK